MSYTVESKEAAEAIAAGLNSLLTSPHANRYAAERYPSYVDGVPQDIWGVSEYQTGYFKDGSERALGFIWNPAGLLRWGRKV